MKSTLTLRFAIQNKTRSLLLPVLTRRFFLLTLVSFVAVAALLGIAASANKANRASKAATNEGAASQQAKSGNNPQKQSPNAPSVVGVSASLTDNVTPNTTKVAPGATVNYTAVITSTGGVGEDALTTNYNAPLDSNTTFTAGTLHASPIAFNESYNWVGNTQLNTTARALPAVTANDVAVNATLPTPTADTFNLVTQTNAPTTLAGGLVTLNADGSFVYTPPVGRPNVADGPSVTDTFNYTITNSADATLVGTGTVSIVLTGRVWYLQAGAAGDGRSNTPSGSPVAMSTAADKSTDVFYIFSDAGSLNGLFTVDAGQQLLGQGVNLVVNAITLFTAAAPTPTTTNTAGNCVALAGAPGNNTVSGFNIGNCTGGTAITGANVGTLNVSTLSINTNGGALDLTGVGAPTVSVVLGGTTSTGGARNVNLIGLNGTFTLAGGALSGATGNALHMDGGNAGLTYSGTISNSGARQVNIINKTGGTVALSGAIGGTGTGIFLNANNGATLNFTGGIALSTGANAAFTATGPGPAATSGGTINVTQNNTSIVNTLTTTTGTALNVANTTIGASGLTVRSISANGGSNGVVLNNTGTTAGLTVTGNGGSCNAATPTCTGGTIQNMVGADDSSSTPIGTGMVLNNTNSVSLTRIRIRNSSNYDIRGTAVNGFTLDVCLVDGATGTNVASPFRDSNVTFTNLYGTANFTNSEISGGVLRNIEIINTNSDGAAGRPALNLTVNLCNIHDTGKSPFTGGLEGDDGLLLENQSTANITAHITNNTFSQHSGDHFNGSLTGSGTVTYVVTGNAYSNTLTGGRTTLLAGGFFILGATYNGTFTYKVSDNGTAAVPLTGNRQGGAIHVNKGSGSANFSGRIENNFIGIAGTTGSGSSEAFGIIVGSRGTGSHTTLINNNTVRQYFDRGIVLEAGEGSSALDATVTNNTVSNFADAINSLHGIHSDNGILGTDTSTICMDIRANSVATAGNEPAGGADIRLRKGTGVSVRIPGLVGGTATDVDNKITADNPTATTVTVTNPGATNFTGGGACATAANPTIPNPADDNVRQMNGAIDGYRSTNAMAQAKTELANAPVAQTTFKQISSKVRIASVTSKATPKASAAEVARIYRSERPMSHHAVRSNTKAFVNAPNMVLAGETINVPIGTLPAGKSITIKYAATLNVPPLARQVSTQGTVSGSNFASVLTDDPDAVGSPNPTVTLIDTLVTWNGSTNTDWNTATNWTPPAGGTQYAPGVSNPAVNDVVIPNVGAQPNISATDIGIYSLNISNGRTLTITNPRVLTIGGSPGGDLTLDGIISGGNLNLGTGTHAINNAGGTGSLSSTNVATVLSGSIVTLNNNLQAGALAVNAGGSMNITNRTLSLNGTGGLVVPGGATFTTTGSTVIFNGTAAQQAAGIAYNNLTINNTAAGAPNALGATLAGNASVAGTLALTSNDLNTSTFTLTQPNTTASTGAGDVVGTVTRTGGPFGLISLTFGNPNNIITFTGAGTRPTTMTVAMAKAAPATYAAAVQRNYTMSQTGGSGFTATVRLHYLDTELNGNIPEANLGLRRLRTSDSHWVAAPPPPGTPTRDGSANWVEATGVLAADMVTQWTFSTLAPTASDGIVIGRIVDDQGNPVEGAVVRLQGTQNRKFITDANGFYRFENVETNGFYTVTPSRVNYQFSPTVQSFSQIGETTNATFGATRTDGTENPLDTPEYFVRQHYIDFLGREPDEAGFNFWSDQILDCGFDQNCIGRRRENVSAAYFLSIEFQQTGGLVDGLYRASYGTAPQFGSFMPDTRAIGLGVVVGREGWEAKLAANKEAFINAFVNRPAFHAQYDGMDNSLFVDTLINHTGVSFTSGERDAWVSSLANGTSRADVLRSIAENQRFVNAKFNEAFVMMEYFGYLRRDPDTGGFAFWLNKLNQFNGNFEQAEMVRAFIVSGEYRDRFPR